MKTTIENDKKNDNVGSPSNVDINTGQQVYIYKCSRKQGSFLYLPEKDNFEGLPESLLGLLGELSFSFEFNLTHNRKLIQTDAKTVLQHISKTGYFLQLAPPTSYIPTSLDDTVPSGF